MVHNSKNWLQKPNVSMRWVFFACVLWSLFLSILLQTRFVEDIKTKVSRPFDFRVREALGKSPKIDKRIKTFAIDDSAVSFVGSPNLPIHDWSKLLTKIAQKEPAAIIVDSLFTIAGIPSGMEEASNNAIKELEKAGAPFYVGAFPAPRKIRYRKTLPLDGSAFDLRMLVRGSDSIEEALNSLEVKKATSAYVYGPDPLLRKAFPQTGHLLYKGDSKSSLYLRLDHGLVLPHLMVMPFKDRSIVDGDYFINGHKVPTYKDGSVPLNYASFSYYLSKIKSLKENLERSQKGLDINGVEKGDFVYIIPAFFTGNTDFKLTPFGPMPAGLTHLALLNSILKDDWLTPIGFEILLIFLGCLFGSFVAKKMTSLSLIFSLLLGISLWLSACIYSFSFHGVIVPWILPLAGFLATAVTVFIEKSRIAEKKSQFIRNCLDGAFEDEKVKQMSKKPELLSFSAREQVVTVMFIDVVGFSLVAENQLPRIAFDQLKDILGGIADTVHEYGGIVNKNLGDGLLCFFGYSLETNISTPDHAEQAVKCASVIQKRNLPRTLEQAKKGYPVFPLRIGINTSSVFVGNIGSEERIDLTIVGNGVNFAKRLEGACTNHAILMAATTKELIESLALFKEGMEQKYITIKHHVGKVEAFEFDPFHADPELRRRALEVHRKSIDKVHEEDQEYLKNGDLVKVLLESTACSFVSYAKSGLSVSSSEKWQVGSFVKLRLMDDADYFEAHFDNLSLSSMEMEIVSCLEVKGGFTYALRYRNLDKAMKVKILEIFRGFEKIQIHSDAREAREGRVS